MDVHPLALPQREYSQGQLTTAPAIFFYLAYVEKEKLQVFVILS